MYANLQTSFLRVQKYFEDFKSVTYSMSEKYIIEVGDKIKETGKKSIFTLKCFGTNNVKNY